MSNAEAKREVFHAIQQKGKRLEGLFKVLADLQKQVDVREGKGELAEAYFLLTEHAKGLAAVDGEGIWPAGEFERRLIEAQQADQVAASAVRDKTNEHADAIGSHARALADLEQRESGRRAALLEAVAVATTDSGDGD
jgi:hypothetical protein